MSDKDFSPLGVLEEQILVAVVRVRDGYGMEIRREIERVTGRDVSIAAVYARRTRLEAKGLIESRRAQDANGSRRLFALCTEGARALAETHALRERLWAGVDLRR